MTDKERQQRIHYHMYTTNEGIAEHAERIVALEELVQDMDTCISHGAGWDCDRCPLHDTKKCPLHDIEKCDFDKRMDELGVPR